MSGDRDIFRLVKKTQYDIVTMNICLYTFAKAMKCTTRMNPKVNLTLNDHDVGSSSVKKNNVPFW